VSGDLTSVFRPYNGETITLPEWLDRNKHVQKIYNARFKKMPNNFKSLTADEVEKISNRSEHSILPQQEPGTKPSNGLKYELHVDGKLSEDGKDFIIRFKAGKDIFGDNALGAPFNVYAPGNYWNNISQTFDAVRSWAFAVKPGDGIEYRWPLKSFEGGAYHLRVYGPNGYFREFSGNSESRLDLICEPLKKGQKLTGLLKINLKNTGKQILKLKWVDDKYQNKNQDIVLKPGATGDFRIDTSIAQGWYNFSLYSLGTEDIKVLYAGRLETGADSISDPFMGRRTINPKGVKRQ
jgi:phospholipase C